MLAPTALRIGTRVEHVFSRIFFYSLFLGFTCAAHLVSVLQCGHIFIESIWRNIYYATVKFSFCACKVCVELVEALSCACGFSNIVYQFILDETRERMDTKTKTRPSLRDNSYRFIVWMAQKHTIMMLSKDGIYRRKIKYYFQFVWIIFSRCVNLYLWDRMVCCV